MVKSRLAVFVGMLAFATLVIQTDASLSMSDADPASYLVVPEPSVLLILLAAAVAFAVAATPGAPMVVRRRRVNRARLRLRRAQS